MGKAGRVPIEQKYAMEKLNDELVEIYQQILHSEVSQPLSPEQLVDAGVSKTTIQKP